MTIYINACRSCLFFLGSKECAAFPDGIPDDIWEGRNDHAQPVDGDHGIQFEPLDEAPPMTRAPRYVTLYVDQVARTAEVHIQRPNSNRIVTCDRVLSSIEHTYILHEGEPSINRIWALLRERKHTDYGAQHEWGVTSSNGRDRSVYVFEGSL